MMRQTDDATADAKFSEVFGRQFKSSDIKAPRYMLEGDGGAMMFVEAGPRTYKITLGFDLASRGLNAKAAINDGIAWLFNNTDAETIIGNIAADNKACLAMVPHTYGYELIDHGDVKRYVVTRKAWEARKQ